VKHKCVVVIASSSGAKEVVSCEHMHAWTAGRRRGYAWGMRAIKNQQVHQKKRSIIIVKMETMKPRKKINAGKQCMEQVPRERENKKRE
jgi:hypothetical protein